MNPKNNHPRKKTFIIKKGRSARKEIWTWITITNFDLALAEAPQKLKKQSNEWQIKTTAPDDVAAELWKGKCWDPCSVKLSFVLLRRIQYLLIVSITGILWNWSLKEGLNFKVYRSVFALLTRSPITRKITKQTSSTSRWETTQRPIERTMGW